MKLVAALVAISLAAGCGSPEPGSDTETPAADETLPRDPVNPGTGLGNSPGTTADAGTTIGNTPNGDPNGTPSNTDAGAVTEAGTTPAAGGPFTGAPDYKATLGPSTLIKRHVFNSDNPAGQACLTCHTGEKGIPKFMFGGTVYTDATGTKPAASVEVRVRDAAGKGYSAYSDANGNFFFRQDALPALAAPAKAGVRDAKGTHVMANAISDGSCNGCHRVGGQAPLHI
jgi:hypothetical protein